MTTRKPAAFILLVAVMIAGPAYAAEDEGKLAPKEVASDTNADGKPDRWERYENGVLTALEADANGDGTIDEKGVIENGRLLKVEKDSDFDGKTDKWISY